MIFNCKFKCLGGLFYLLNYLNNKQTDEQISSLSRVKHFIFCVYYLLLITGLNMSSIENVEKKLFFYNVPLNRSTIRYWVQGKQFKVFHPAFLKKKKTYSGKLLFIKS